MSCPQNEQATRETSGGSLPGRATSPLVHLGSCRCCPTANQRGSDTAVARGEENIQALEAFLAPWSWRNTAPRSV